MTVCCTSDHKEKHVGKKHKLQLEKKISEFKSLESSDSVQRNEGGQGNHGKTTGQPEEVCGRYRSSSVRPDDN